MEDDMHTKFFQQIRHLERAATLLTQLHTINTIIIDVEYLKPMKELALAWWGCVDSVIQFIVNKSLMLDINGITGITGTQYVVVRA